MATRWHVNPRTGETGKCSAEYSCPFGGSFNGHQDTKREAARMYEQYREGLFESQGVSHFYFLSDEEHEWFTQGDCGNLAKELNRVTGYPIVAVGIRGKAIDGTSWEHVAVRAPDGRILDVTGIQPSEETEKAWSSHGLYEVVFEEVEDHQVDTYLNRSSEDDFKEANPQRTAKRIVEALRG